MPNTAKLQNRNSNSGYRIIYGDTLSGIALKFGVTVAQLAEWNNIPNVNKIYAGRRLIVKEPAHTSVKIFSDIKNTYSRNTNIEKDSVFKSNNINTMDEYYDNIMKGRPWDEKVGIWLRKHNADKFDEKATEAIRPIAQGIVLFNPLVGVVNDVKTLFAGEDIYGNKATRLDKGVAVASLATFGIVRSAKYISSVAKRVPEYAVKLYNKINLGTTIYSGVNATKEEFKK